MTFKYGGIASLLLVNAMSSCMRTMISSLSGSKNLSTVKSAAFPIAGR